MLPGIQGLELCKIIRGIPETSNLPIIMLTAKGEEFDKPGERQDKPGVGRSWRRIFGEIAT